VQVLEKIVDEKEIYSNGVNNLATKEEKLIQMEEER
jgi:hypothetical protein